MRVFQYFLQRHDVGLLLTKGLQPIYNGTTNNRLAKGQLLKTLLLKISFRNGKLLFGQHILNILFFKSVKMMPKNIFAINQFAQLPNYPLVQQDGLEKYLGLSGFLFLAVNEMVYGEQNAKIIERTTAQCLCFGSTNIGIRSH